MHADEEQRVRRSPIVPGDGLFCEATDGAAWVGIEYMAQAIAALGRRRALAR